MGGTWGAIATGIFASGALTSTGGLINGNWMQMLLQILATAVTWLSPSS
jgi:Amt family ammonium transporter